ncbi:Phage-related baseplate assembly protein [Planctomycetes bacterium Pan216]|uniref:Phage-related baseplate assembly protein n=1 Tax=Kolteria novifilia TaxID=2527975 RepID=A0A518B160_9BACT|nr:Phage-related baseplate assembly protein [Planctomycetes bacterium Pan216]
MDEQLALELSLTTSLANLAIGVHGFEGTESVSDLYRYRLHLHTDASAELPVRELLGKEVTLRVRVGALPERSLHGIIAELGHVGRTPTHQLHEAVLVPKVALLTYEVGYQILQDKTFTEILDHYLEGYPRQYVLNEDHASSRYAVRYADSPWDYLLRLLEREGCHFYFRQDDGCGTFVVADSSTRASASHDQPLPLRRQSLEPSVRSWKLHREATPWKTRVSDHHLECPGADLSKEAASAHHLNVGQRACQLGATSLADCVVDRHELFAHRFGDLGDDNASSANSLDGLFQERDRLAKVRLGQALSGSVRGEGIVNAPCLVPGMTFPLGDADQDNGDYFVTSIHQRAALPLDGFGAWESSPYECSFECVPVELAYRLPRREGAPAVPSVETALALAEPSQEVTVDKAGAVKAKFLWDDDEGRHSRSIPVLRSLSGDHYGEVYPPHRDDELLIAYEHGHPERPFVLGSLYNISNPPPVDASELRHVQGHWVRGRGGPVDRASRFTIDQRSDHEKVALYSAGTAQFSAEGSQTIQSGDSLSLRVGADPTNALKTMQADQSIGNYILDVNGNTTETTDGDQETNTAGNHSISTKDAVMYVYVEPALWITKYPLSFVSATSLWFDGLHVDFALAGGRLRMDVGFLSGRWYTTPLSFRQWNTVMTKGLIKMDLSTLAFFSGVFAALVGTGFMERRCNLTVDAITAERKLIATSADTAAFRRLGGAKYVV